MSNKISARNTWVRVLIALAFVVVAVGAWGIGRASSNQATQGEQNTQEGMEATGFDIGVAGKPNPTGKLREFNLVAKEAEVEIAPGVTVMAFTYNGQVPGPTIRVTEGDTLRVTLKNELDKATTIHWHGLHVPNSMDGVSPLTQQGIEPGQSFTYEFPASHAGTFMYHPHLNSVEQIEVGQKPVQVAFSPEGKYVYFSLNTENAVGKVDVASRALVGKVGVGIGPVQVYVTPDNKYLLAANQGTQDKPSTTVSIIDTETFQVVKTVETGKGAHGVVIDPSGKHAYITNIYGNDVAVLDIAEQKVVATIPVGEAPNGVSMSALAPAPATTPEIKLVLPGEGQNEEQKDDMLDMP